MKIEGLKLLQFISEAASQGVLLHGVERESYSRVFARASWADYRRLLALARNKPLRVVALAETGLPGITRKALRRLAFSIGMVACIAALAAVNLFVLDVRVEGCSTPGLQARVIEIAAREGLRPGAGKAALDLHGIELSMLTELKEITFAAVRVNGVVATVNVVEGVPAPALIDRDRPCDVVARREGVVRKVILYEGQAMAAAGDTVRRGQVLAGGAVIMKDGGSRFVHARADVYASVWYEGRARAPLIAEKNVRTGRAAATMRMELAGFSLPMGGAGPEVLGSVEAEETSEYLLGPGLKGPRLVTTTYYEYVPQAEEKDFGAALDTAVRQALEQALAEVPLGAGIVGGRTDYDYRSGDLVVRVFVEALENIAVETPLS